MANKKTAPAVDIIAEETVLIEAPLWQGYPSRDFITPLDQPLPTAIPIKEELDGE
jgi:hypothetical protein